MLISDVRNLPRFEGRNLDARAHFDRVLERRDPLARSRGVAGGGVGQGNAIGGGSSRVRNWRATAGSVCLTRLSAVLAFEGRFSTTRRPSGNARGSNKRRKNSALSVSSQHPSDLRVWVRVRVGRAWT